jgi:hypothetical protein
VLLILFALASLALLVAGARGQLYQAKVTEQKLSLLDLAILLLEALFGAAMLGMIARWRSRDRWAGPLMLDISRPRENWMLLLSVCAAAILILSLFEKPIHPLFLVGSASSCLLVFWSFISRGTAEIRQRGFLIEGDLLPWSQIESYAWEENIGNLVVLKLRARRSPSERAINVSVKHKATTETILHQHLAEWPAV